VVLENDEDVAREDMLPGFPKYKVGANGTPTSAPLTTASVGLGSIANTDAPRRRLKFPPERLGRTYVYGMACLALAPAERLPIRARPSHRHDVADTHPGNATSASARNCGPGARLRRPARAMLYDLGLDLEARKAALGHDSDAASARSISGAEIGAPLPTVHISRCRITW
jgi:hypothetical protein